MLRAKVRSGFVEMTTRCAPASSANISVVASKMVSDGAKTNIRFETARDVTIIRSIFATAKRKPSRGLAHFRHNSVNPGNELTARSLRWPRKIEQRGSVDFLRGPPNAAGAAGPKGFKLGQRRNATLMKRMRVNALYRRPIPRNRCRSQVLFRSAAKTADHPTPSSLGDGDHRHAMARGFIDLAVVRYGFTRRFLAWRVSITLEGGFCRDAVAEARGRQGMPEIFNTASDTRHAPSLQHGSGFAAPASRPYWPMGGDCALTALLAGLRNTQRPRSSPLARTAMGWSRRAGSSPIRDITGLCRFRDFSAHRVT